MMRVSELPRPSPERLLRQAQAEENKRWGARLKIFLGYAPGVGKSYRMLDALERGHLGFFGGASGSNNSIQHL
jgi:two-component system, OmpR family, sensor histidine kinase KdpD